MIQTQGYPSFAIREFLHLLSVNLPWCEFVFYTDHDTNGFYIYLCLKYGCRKSAWASPSMVCLQLQWGGPSRQQVFEHTTRHAHTVYRDSLKMSQPDWLDNQLQDCANRWLTHKLTRLNEEIATVGPQSESVGLLSCIHKKNYLRYESKAQAIPRVGALAPRQAWKNAKTECRRVDFTSDAPTLQRSSVKALTFLLQEQMQVLNRR